MKRLIFTTIICLISLGCAAQKIIKTTQGQDGRELSYVSSDRFNDFKINSKVKIGSIKKASTAQNIIALLGKPTGVKNEKDTAIDGTVLFERKLISYPGLLFVFPKKNGKYKLSRIDFTSNNSALKMDGKKIQVGMNIQEMSDISSSIKQSETNGIVKIHVSDAKNSGENIKSGQQGQQENVKLSDQYISIEYDPATKIVKKISILMYTI